MNWNKLRTMKKLTMIFVLLVPIAAHGQHDHMGMTKPSTVTLEKGLGPEFTPEVRDAWTTVYGVLAATMKAGVEERLAEAV